MSLHLESKPRLDSLTSLRFFAALAIFFLHSAEHNLFESDILEIFDFSKAVTFFFVLSGFVLTYAYSGNSFDLFRFYSKRFLRVWPSTLVSLFFVLLILPPALYLPSANGTFHYGPVFVSHLLLIHSLIPIPDFFFGFNAVSWSVSVEAFFYMLFPFFRRLHFVHLLRTISLLSFFLILLSFMFLPLGIPAFSANDLSNIVWNGFVYISPLFRLPEFLIGICCYILYSEQLILFPGIKSLLIPHSTSLKLLRHVSEIFLFFLFLFLGFSFHLRFLPLPSQLLFDQIYSAIFFSFAIIILLFSRGFLSFVLESRVLVYLGEISFGLYLYHQPLLIRAAQYNGLMFKNIQLLPNSLPLLLLYSIILAALNHKYVEKFAFSAGK